MLQTDKIIKDPMNGGDLVYVTEISPEVTNYMSLSSGFWTNSLMKKGSEFYEEQIVLLPDLYKDLAWEDPETKLIWLPNTINIPDLGMVFANGSNSSNWGWAGVKSIDVLENEKTKYPIPGKKGQYYSKRMDMTTLQMFDKNNYLDALSYIGILPE